MRIAIASGKGGTGKTTVAVNLAFSFAEPVQLLDCDVEEPNCHLFLPQPAVQRTEPVTVPIPRLVKGRCTACGACASLCRFNAIAALPKGVLLFAELCHSCGGCTRVCPEQALVETAHRVGTIEEVRAGAVSLITGRLEIGEAKAPPLIRAVKERARSGVVLVDAPPGTTCSMVAAVRGCDAAVLVTEPTPFGLADLIPAVATVRTLGLPCVVVLNRDGTGDQRVERYCAEQEIPIVARFADDRRVAEAYARGQTIINAVPETAAGFTALAERLRQLLEQRPVPRIVSTDDHAGGPDHLTSSVRHNSEGTPALRPCRTATGQVPRGPVQRSYLRHGVLPGSGRQEG